MTFTSADIRRNRDYFLAKLGAVKQNAEVLKWAKGGEGDFLLLDVRGREAFAKGHVTGALCTPAEELADLAKRLPRTRELVTFCWSHL